MVNILKSRINEIIFFIVLSTFGFWIPSHFSFTRTKSLDHRLFYLAAYSEKDRTAVPRGSFILFTIKHPLMARLLQQTGTNKIIKRITCSEGSSLKVIDRNFFCDGRSIGRAMENTPGGIKIDYFNYNGVIPVGSYFVMGSSPDSFDSRYFGFVEKKSIIAVAYPVI